MFLQAEGTLAFPASTASVHHRSPYCLRSTLMWLMIIAATMMTVITMINDHGYMIIFKRPPPLSKLPLINVNVEIILTMIMMTVITMIMVT